MKILSYNIRSWYRDLNPLSPRYWRKRAQSIRHIIEREAPDVLLLQEALWPMTRKCIPSGYIRATRGVSHHIFIRKGLAEIVRHGWTLHTATALLRFPDAHRATFTSVHGHWDDAKFERLVSGLRKDYFNEPIPTYIGGDWNKDAGDRISQIVTSFLVPPFRLAVPDCITFQNWKSGATGTIDYFAVAHASVFRAGLAYKCSFADSDHLPVILEVTAII